MQGGPFKRKYGSLFEDKDLDVLSLSYQVVYFLHRILLALVLVCLDDKPLAQVHLVFWMQLLVTVFTFKSVPYRNKLANLQLFVNEICITICAMLLFPFYYKKRFDTVRIDLAWAFVSIVFLNVVFNLIISIYNAFRACKKMCKRRKQGRDMLSYDDEEEGRTHTEQVLKT